MWDYRYILFTIVSGISEYAGVEATTISVTTVDYKAMDVCLYKFIIKEYIPLRVIYFSMAMGHERAIRPFSTRTFGRKSFECVGKLRKL